jgi:Na+-driven multidrug efflux pump
MVNQLLNVHAARGFPYLARYVKSGCLVLNAFLNVILVFRVLPMTKGLRSSEYATRLANPDTRCQ